ncbi:MAG: glycogen/starch/alpha-glucan phosphorylase [Oscillospiraceae bacterium]|jgi:starch phosphorylase|nr:glycogen/starch/alpha-glucan phosphorylase [Oscillospiraceae bacterium]MCI1990908.1 glycogen/starch/alpha-glucan phosphorylase [Oscillospiraceae bacterium]MCI2034409.1 glycogen/starch/alpha-glucan phosphorylase [Oscillospiraceae bacterium]
MTDFLDSEFSSEMKRKLLLRSGGAPEAAAPQELHEALSECLMERVAPVWEESRKRYARGRRVFYLSAEFLVGRAVYNNVLALGLTEKARELFKSLGADWNAMEEVEDAALGNGGLGRLAACYMDSAATLGLPVRGYGIRYRFGLFRQKFKNGFQTEQADDWTRYGDPWSVRRERDAATVRYADGAVRAVPYDMPVIGYGGKNVNTIRLWQSEPEEPFDFGKFNGQRYDEAVGRKNRAEDISRALYPNDTTDEGKILRIRQEYFFCSASMQDILHTYTARHGEDFSKLADFCAVQMNDTHPAVAVCELIRLLEGRGVGFETAFGIARRTFRYTNHTVMAEALETWDEGLYASVLPEICKIIGEIARYQKAEFTRLGGKFAENLAPCAVVTGETARDGAPEKRTVRMANLAVYASAAVNGVAKLHTEILKNDVLKAWYELYPERFHNVTNGITQRRWLALCNPGLAALITRLLGSRAWVTDLSQLKKLEPFAADGAVLDEFRRIKQEQKRRLSELIARREGAEIPPDFLFDIQAKRLHEYKRQFLNALSILDLYYGIKDGSVRNFTPTAFLFGAKAAPGYVRAKGIIKLINEIARLVDSDPAVRDRLRVAFVQNYDVSYAEKLVPAADLSEQISTAGTEASGTGNMKFMLNGAPTLGTYDGANIEIVERAGLENNYIFGARVEELDRIRETYDPAGIYRSDARVRRVLDALTDGTLDDGGTGVFAELRDSILKGASWHRPDQYFLLYDFNSYREARLRANRDFRDGRAFARKGFLNVANAGYFSSDRSVREYAREIWGL